MSAAGETPLYAFTQNPFAAERLTYLLAGMTSHWPRRGRKLLAVSAAATPLPESLWQAGFDLTVQDRRPEALNAASETLKTRAAYILGVPDHLPVDDCAFDYGVALIGPEDPLGDMLRELRRAVCRGVLLIFASSWSIAALEHRVRGRVSARAAGFLSPCAVRREAVREFAGCRPKWGAVLPGPTRTWGPGFWSERLNAPLLAAPVGAVVGLRFDMGAPRAGTPLLVRATHPATSTE